MDDIRKHAYRMVLYHAMLDLRAGGPSFSPVETATLNAGEIDQIAEELRHAKLIAYWLHNLAQSSANDFSSFDEAAFWGQHQFFKEKSPVPARFDGYRIVFESFTE